jgi:two-component system phosphate regulon sensor histidine kinase PhoR
MTKKIFQSILLVAGCVLLASLLIIMGFLYDYFGGVEENQLRDELSLASAAVEDGGTDYLSRLTADRYRLTWIAADGGVLYDTRTDAESLENHASRAEVSQALTTGTGESTRYSSTLMEKTMYYAHGAAHLHQPRDGRHDRRRHDPAAADRAHRGAHPLRLAGQAAVAAHR